MIRKSILTAVLFCITLWLSGCGGSSSPNPVSPGQIKYSGWAVGVEPDGGYGMIIHTNDSGNTWVRQGSVNEIPDVPLGDVCAINSMNAWVVGDSSDGYGLILRTTDGGSTWVRQGSNGVIPDCALSGIRAVNNMIAWAAGTNGVILKTVDGGITWTRVDHGMVPGEGLLQSVWGVDENTAWVSGADSNSGFIIMKTTDGGQSWVRQGTTEQMSNYTCIIEITALNEMNAWGVGAPQESYGHTPFLNTVDGGENWTNQAPADTALLHGNGVCVASSNTIWVAHDEGIYLTRDGGLTWSIFAPPGPYGSFSPFMGVSAVDDKTAWVVFNGLLSGDYYIIQHTGDGGATWTQQATPVTKGGLRRISIVGAKR
ncbi:MAG: YCF48-related protein [bacterium]